MTLLKKKKSQNKSAVNVFIKLGIYLVKKTVAQYFLGEK